MPDELKLSDVWAAGYFQARGRAFILCQQRRSLGSLWAGIESRAPGILRGFAVSYGGSIHEGVLRHQTTMRTRQKTYAGTLERMPAWIITTRGAARFLRTIRPFVVGQTMKAYIGFLLDFQASKSSSRKNLKEYRAIQENFRETMDVWRTRLIENRIEPPAKESA